MSLRAEVAVPSAIAFLFGAGVGLTVGWLIGSGGQTRLAEPRAGAGTARPMEGQASAAQREVQLREGLAMHQQLVAESPDNPRLLRTIGEYHAALGEHEEAIEAFLGAEAIVRPKGPPEELPEVLFGLALSYAETDRYRESLDALEEAAELEPGNVAPRLIQVYIYMRRIMPAPPAGFDRRAAVLRAEELLDEILVIEPEHVEATQLKEAIVSVRRGREVEAQDAP